jgi:flavodoxin
MTGTLAGPPGPALTTDAGGDASAKAGGTLVAFFSYSGRTKRVAAVVHELTGGQLFEIRPKKLYNRDYHKATAVARKEKETKARPPIFGGCPDMAGIGTVFLGYPNWWFDMPMSVYTFLESYDFAGKTVAPFCTSGGSGLSGTVKTLRKLLKNSTVTEGLSLEDRKVNGASVAVTEWLGKIGFRQTG